MHGNEWRLAHVHAHLGASRLSLAHRIPQYCCAKRGTYYAESGLSATGCDGSILSPSGFFYQGVFTYQECFTDLAPDVCVGLPPSPVAGRVLAGPLVAAPPPSPFARSYAIILPDLMEGAYRLTVDALDPADIYCTGRGVVSTDALACEINTCGLSTPNFVSIATPPIPGQFCYHACFHV